MDPRLIPLDWLPTIPRRYSTTAIDGLLILAVFIIPTALFPANEGSRALRIVIALLALFVYEPLGTGRWLTLGQWVTGVRVRRMEDGSRIGVLRAWGRIVVKVFLGILSFLTLPLVPGRRAIHDLASGSIVILARSEGDFVRWTSAQSPEKKPEGSASHSAV